MPHPVDVHVGQKLKSLRLLRGKSQTNVSNQLETSFQQVQKYEQGTNRVSASRLFEAAKILGVAPATFFDGLDGAIVSSLPVLNEETVKIASLVSQITDPATKTQILNLTKAVVENQQPMQIAAA